MKTYTVVETRYGQPAFETVQIIEDGQAIAILVREADGTVSAVRIGIGQLAD